MAGGIRQSGRAEGEAIEKLDRRVKLLESKKIPSQMKLKPSSTYTQSEIVDIINKINELLRELAK